MAKNVLLTEATDEQLGDEIQRRSGLVASIWNVEDVISLVTEDDDCAELEEGQQRAIAELFLSRASRKLQDVLAERGNESTTDLWLALKDEVLTEAKAAAVSPKA